MEQCADWHQHSRELLWCCLTWKWHGRHLFPFRSASHWLPSRKALNFWSWEEKTHDWPVWTPYQETTSHCTSCSVSMDTSSRWTEHQQCLFSIPVFVLTCGLVSVFVQVVFLYERSGNYLWHGALRLHADMDRSFAPFKQLDYGRHPGAYDRYHKYWKQATVTSESLAFFGPGHSFPNPGSWGTLAYRF